MASWRDERNDKARARLARSLPAVFPAGVLAHAMARPLVPPTPRLAVESYWRHHVLRAEALSRKLAASTGAPEGWSWDPGSGRFREPPLPWRDSRFAPGPGRCCVCGGSVWRYGWHTDLWADGTPNRRAAWHAACVTALQLWVAPSSHAKALRKAQQHRCAATGKRLLRSAEVDHGEPLYRVWRTRRDTPWPELLAFWGRPNLQVVNRAAHVAKCAEEAAERAGARRLSASPPDGG